MKKSLIALATLAACSASFAQSSVTIYGQFDAGVYSIKGYNAGKSATVYGDGATFSNVLGFRGTEDLGGGLRAVFNAETDVQTNNGGQNQNGLFRRQANVGVAGSFGEIRIGTTLNPLIATNGALLPVAGNSVMTNISAALGYGDFFNRNAVTYTSRNIGGVVGQLQHGFSNNADGLTEGSVTAGSLSFTQGPLQLRAAAQKRNGAVATNTSAAVPTAAAAATSTASWPNVVGNSSGIDKTSYVLGARYSLGALSLGAAYMSNEWNVPGSAENKLTGYALGVGYTTGAWTLGANYANAEKSTLTNVQARYALSRRTNIIATAGAASNDSTVAFAPIGFNTGSAPAPITNTTLGTLGNRGTGRDITGFGVAVTHSF